MGCNLNQENVQALIGVHVQALIDVHVQALIGGPPCTCIHVYNSVHLVTYYGNKLHNLIVNMNYII